MLRQALGKTFLHDTYTSLVTATGPQSASLSHVIDSGQVNLDFVTQGLHVRSWLLVNGMEFRVGSFNAYSGAYVMGQVAATLISINAEYERHAKLSPTDKDRALDDAIGRIRVNREVGIPSVDGQSAYPLDAAASPNLIETALDAYYFADATNTSNRDKRAFDQWAVVPTATGNELRVSPALGASSQVVVDAILVLSLGASDAATINIPSQRWVLAGAAAKAWDMLLTDAPGQSRGQYEKSRNEAARLFSSLSSALMPQIDRPMNSYLSDPF